MYDVEEEKKLTPKDKAHQRTKKFFNSSFNLLQGFVVFAAIFVVLYLLFITPHQVDGISMDPTFEDGEFLIANKVVYKARSPQRGDVVIFRFSETRDFIKRVLAVPGDTIEVRSGSIYVNGEYLDESEYLDPSVYTDSGFYLHEGDILIIPEGKVFVSGDNRDYSTDSRAFGPVEISQVKGKVIMVIYPISSFHFIGDPGY